MREYLFRGKTDKGEWIEGGVAINYADSPFIVLKKQVSETVCAIVRVIPETVGQYTGLADKNGKKIFEGDIVRAVYKSGYIGMPDKDFGNGIVEYYGTYYSGASYHINTIEKPGSRVFSASLEVEIIGNIHDNPELMKEVMRK